MAVDDTDDESSRGTGFLARNLARELQEAGLIRTSGVTRHQLLVDDRIPYTSHNSSACIAVERTGAGEEEIAGFAAGFLGREAASRSDAGLCVANAGCVGPAIISFGRRAKTELLTAAEAHSLAAAAGVHLSGHTGERIGVIGALAAVGLRHAGNDGRFLELAGLRRLRGVVRIGELEAIGVRRFRTDAGQVTLSSELPIDVGDWCRPLLVEGTPTLLVEEVVDCHEPEVQWRVQDKERVKKQSA
ncbi:MAG: hypothetical protein KGJ86_03400 [Chloroflexota bacterium]|nr:hypothetical protein [Chloroflexota bacterium]